MPILQDLRKRKYKTVKAFAEAYGCSPSKASGILNGKYHLVLSKGEVKHLAFVLGVSFIECADACDDSFAESRGYKGDAWKTSKRKYQGILHKGIWACWQWEEDMLRDTRKAADSGAWTEYRRKYASDSSSSQSGKRQSSGSTTTRSPTCFTILGLSSSASVEQIKAAFRIKVKAASDGKGGYRGDMDRLVQAKEQALEYASIRVTSREA